MARCFVCQREMGAEIKIQDDGRALCVHCDRMEAHYRAQQKYTPVALKDPAPRPAAPVPVVPQQPRPAATPAQAAVLPAPVPAAPAKSSMGGVGLVLVGLSVVLGGTVGAIPLVTLIFGLLLGFTARPRSSERKISWACMIVGLLFLWVAHNNWNR